MTKVTLFFISQKRIYLKVRLHLIYPQVYAHIHLYNINSQITFPHYPQPRKKLYTFYVHKKTILSTDNMVFIHRMWLILCITTLQYLILDLHLKLMSRVFLVRMQLYLQPQSSLHYLCIKIEAE